MDKFESVFEATPKEKFFDILFHANRSLVEDELEKIFKELLLKSSLDNSNLEENLSDFYIELSSNILSKNE